MLSNMRTIGGLALLAGLAAAQTFTDCNPMERDDCPPCEALNMDYNFDWTHASNSTTWDRTNGNILYEDTGAKFTVAKQKDGPTLTSQWHIMFGHVEVHLKAAPGQGIVSSIVIQSDNLDEIDWELIGGNTTHVQSNYFGKGNQTTYDRAEWHPVDNPMGRFVNYTVDWTKERMEFWIDAQLVRTLPYEAANGGKNFPQTPSFVRVGVWAGGDPDNQPGVIEWAGGLTDYSKGPYTMEVKDVVIRDYGARDFPDSKEYIFGDRTASWQSIEATPGNSTQKIRLLAEPEPPKKSISEKFAELPESSQTAVYAGSAAGGALLIAILGFLCFKKRRQGRREAAAYRAKQEAMDQEDQRWNTELKAKGISPDALGHTGADSKDVVGATVAAAPVRTNSFGSPRSEDQNKFPEPAYSPPQNTSNGGYNEVFQPQPRANTNGSWAGGDMNRTASVASSQWGPAQPASPQSPHFGGQQQYGRLPANNGYNYNNGF